MQTGSQHAVEDLAHDLKNVFQTILQAAELIADDPAQADLAAIIARSVEQGRRILAGASTAGAIVQLAALVEDAARFTSDYARMAGGPGIHFDIEVDPSIAIEVGPAPLERSLINLFVNAADAARHCGMDSLGLRVDAKLEAGETVLTVQDDGPGITDRDLPFIFERGYSSTPAGSGLGLHIVAAAIAAEGGQVSAARGETGGAVFTLRLPSALKAEAAPFRSPGSVGPLDSQGPAHADR